MTNEQFYNTLSIKIRISKVDTIEEALELDYPTEIKNDRRLYGAVCLFFGPSPDGEPLNFDF
tara:strand:- start:480 stop:665 length:186 start_codon:yes stop_codon:yes gene_type:complete